MRNQNNAIEVIDIEKSFNVYFDKSNNLKEKVLFWKRNRYEKRSVLKGISFSVKKGEAIGLIGHNGCGKSTTLKLLTRIMYPDKGTIELKGRVSSLIELGAGFHPDMSGRENIYINASIFGLSRKEIDERIDEIISFSELEDYIENPVRTYSSGMYMRLAFSVAINVDADILLVDEILAVGDIKFQSKCFEKLREIKAKGTTIVIVSHSLNQIEEICERTIWIDQGKIKEIGSPRNVHRHYLEFMNDYSLSKEKANEKNNAEEEKPTSPIDPIAVKKANDKQIIIMNCKLLSNDGKEKSSFVTGESAVFMFDYEVLDKNRGEASIELVVIRNDGLECYETNTFREGIPNMFLNDHGTIKVYIEKINLVSGEYWIEIGLRKKDGFPFDYVEHACKVNMTSLDRERGILRLDHKWDFGEIK